MEYKINTKSFFFYDFEHWDIPLIIYEVNDVTLYCVLASEIKETHACSDSSGGVCVCVCVRS